MNALKIKIQRAIILKLLVEFYFISKGESVARFRKIEPLFFGVDDTGKYYLSGYDLLEMTNDPNKRQKVYDLKNIDIKRFKVLKEKFTTLRIDPDKLYRTKKPGTTVICVADFPEHISKYYKN
jgi:hypothetical protein